ncbi:MAG: adenylate/guanylate cyclase domain-containing protein [Verrucomicrobia bacterium]|nr:adenylate/guanylate cyclase domain-containing protein [Verrucomicrobiota bacterium]
MHRAVGGMSETRGPSSGRVLAASSRRGRCSTCRVLVADLRGFTRIAEQKLPYDTVFLLNRYFEAVGKAITGAGGTLNQFTGDGVMALFGIKDGPEVGCRQALAAVRFIAQEVARLSSDFAHDLPEPLRRHRPSFWGPLIADRIRPAMSRPPAFLSRRSWSCRGWPADSLFVSAGPGSRRRARGRT